MWGLTSQTGHVISSKQSRGKQSYVFSKKDLVCEHVGKVIVVDTQVASVRERDSAWQRLCVLNVQYTTPKPLTNWHDLCSGHAITLLPVFYIAQQKCQVFSCPSLSKKHMQSKKQNIWRVENKAKVIHNYSDMQQTCKLVKLNRMESEIKVHFHSNRIFFHHQ